MIPHKPRVALPLALLLAGLGPMSCGSHLLCRMPSGEPAPFQLTHHALSLHLEPSTHLLQLEDSLRYEGTFTRFELNAGLELTSLEVGGRQVPLKRLVVKASEERGPATRTTYLLACRLPQTGLAIIKAKGTLWQDPEQVRFGHETVGNELMATVGAEGAWLAPEAAILPDAGEGALVPHRVHANLPGDWSLITDGRLVKDETREGRHLMSWDEALPGGALSIAAGPYDIRKEWVDGVELSTWFFRRDPALGPVMGISGPVDDAEVRNTLHRMGAYYLKMYRDGLGPYPYSKFAVVESFFPSGYGMPGWTLLGSQVIRMPYIPYTSLGHELLHNYWGNGVYVKAELGNWCEGLTVYGSDYRYKALESPEAAKEYRKGVLKDYRAYVDGSKDLSLREFQNRHDGATRAIGYGKSMYVFHMLAQRMGAEALDAVQRDMYRTWSGREASWDDWMQACERKGQLDLARFSSQWLDRQGAPALRLEDLDWIGGRLQGRLLQSQGGAPYELDVPLRIECHDGTVLTERLQMDRDTLFIDLLCPEPRRVVVDPDLDLFRLLDGREMEPVVGLVLAEERPLFLAPKAWLDDAGRREALMAFASALKDVKDPEWQAVEDFRASTLKSRSVVVVNAPGLVDGLEASDLRMGPDKWQIAGVEGLRAERSLVLAVKSAANDRKGALLFYVPGPEALPALARKVPHYGKYSYLAFDTAGVNQAKGNLAPRGNPLERRFGGW